MTLVDVTDRVKQLNSIYGKARNAKRLRYVNWTRNLKLVTNKGANSGGESWMPAPRSSEIYPILSTIVAWMGDQHTNINITPATTPHSDYGDYLRSLAMDLSTVMNSIWQTDHFETQIKLTIWDSLIYGAGFVKSMWDATLDDGMGNISLKRIDPWSLYIDPKATSLDDAEYIIEARRMSLDEIERRFPGHREALSVSSGGGSRDLDEKPSLTSEGGFQTSQIGAGLPDTTTLKGVGGIGAGSGPGDGRYGMTNSRRGAGPKDYVIVKEFWVKTNDEWWEDKEQDAGPLLSEKHVAERWRVTIVANDEILLDEYADDLWTHKRHPYSRYVFDDIGELYGISIVDHLAYPQIYINRLLTALQMNAELTGNPKLVLAENLGLSRQSITNKPGEIMSMKGTAAGQAGANLPRWLQPPAMPKQVQELVDFWIARMENVSGLSGAMKGQSPAASQGRQSQAVLSNIQEVTFVRIRAAISNLEHTIEDAGQKLADLIVDNYDQPRTMAIIGQDGEETSIALSYRHFDTPTEEGAAPLKYSLTVDAGSGQPTSLQARQQREIQLFTLGLTDDEACLEGLNWKGDIQAMLARKYQKQQGGLSAPPGARQRRTRGTGPSASAGAGSS